MANRGVAGSNSGGGSRDYKVAGGGGSSVQKLGITCIDSNCIIHNQRTMARGKGHVPDDDLGRQLIQLAGPSNLPAVPIESESDSDYSSSSEDVTEDEFGEELTPALDAAILQTLGRIKRKEGVYGTENVLQEALKEAERRAGSLGVQSLKRVVVDKVSHWASGARDAGYAYHQPYLLADHHRAALLGDSAGVEDDSVPLTNVQEQRKLRAGAISAFKSLAEEDESEGDEEGEDDAGFVLKQRKKEDGELEQEDEEYRRFLLDMGGGEEEVRKILGMGDAPAWRADEKIAESSSVPEKKKKKKDAVLNKAETEEMKREHQEKKEKADDDFLMK